MLLSTVAKVDLNQVGFLRLTNIYWRQVGQRKISWVADKAARRSLFALAKAAEKFLWRRLGQWKILA